MPEVERLPRCIPDVEAGVKAEVNRLRSRIRVFLSVELQVLVRAGIRMGGGLIQIQIIFALHFLVFIYISVFFCARLQCACAVV